MKLSCSRLEARSTRGKAATTRSCLALALLEHVNRAFALQSDLIILRLEQTCLSESTQCLVLVTNYRPLTRPQDPPVVVLRQVQQAHRRSLPCPSAVHYQECPDWSGHLRLRYWCLFVASAVSLSVRTDLTDPPPQTRSPFAPSPRMTLKMSSFPMHPPLLATLLTPAT